MANARSQGILQQNLEVATSREGFDDLPTVESIDSFIHDYEDIIFCWPTRIGWGESRVTKKSNGLMILTRHRLILVGSQPDAIRAAFQLSRVIEYHSFLTIVRVASTVENPPYPSESDSSLQLDGTHLWVSIEPTDDMKGELIRHLCALPYSFVIHMWIQHDPSRPEMPGVLQLPISPDVLEWNRITIGYDALLEISQWLQSGRKGFFASELTQHFSATEKILFAALGEVTIIPKAKSSFQGLARRIGKGKGVALKSFTLQLPTYLLLTTERLFMISMIESKVLKLDQIGLVDYQSGFSGTSLMIDTVVELEETIKIKFERDEKYRLFLETLQLLDLDTILRFDRQSLTLRQLDVLQAFYENETELGIVLEDSPPDRARAGYIYILINPELGTELLKIGKTMRQSELRAKEIFTTGVPGEFIVAYEEHVNDCALAELEIHKRLSAFRVSDRREFFRLPLKDAVRVVSEVAQQVGLV